MPPAAEPAAGRYPVLSVVCLTAGVVLLTLALVAMAADSQNRYAIKSAQHLANSALRAEAERLEGFVGDYAFWSESARNLVVNPAPAWMTENLGPEVLEGLRMTASLVVDGQGLATYAVIDGAELGPEAAERFSDELGDLVRAARDGVGGADGRPERGSTALLLDGQLAVAAASAITWDDGRPTPLAAGAPATLVFVRRIDEEMLSRISDRFLLPGTRLESAGAASPDSVPVTSSVGRELARLAWTGSRPGTDLIDELLLPVVGIVVLAAGLLVLILQRARRSAGDLARSHGQLAAHAAALRDTTSALRVALTDAATANAAKSDFLARMSHELRTPLNAILGFSELIATQFHGPAAAERYRDYGRMIHDSGGLLLSLINDILDLSKIEAGRVDLYETDVDLDPIIEQCLLLLAPTVDAKRLTLSYIPGGLRLFADPRALRQIVLNLLSNAVKFTPAGGRIRIAALDEPGGITITVADNGCGIARSDLARVFQAFGRSRATVAREGEGAGLGLHIAKSLVELQGGSLTLASEPGEGTVATVRLPASRRLAVPEAAD